MTEPIVSVDEVETALMVTLSPDEATLVSDELEPAAERALVSYLGRPIVAGEEVEEVVTVERFPHDGDSTLVRVGRAPVASVEAVTVVGPPEHVIDARFYTARRNYIEFFSYIAAPVLSGLPVQLRLNYTTAVPYGADGVIRDAIMARVQRKLLDTLARKGMLDRGEAGLRSVSVEGYARTYDKASGNSSDGDAEASHGFTGEELRSVRKYKRRVMR